MKAGVGMWRVGALGRALESRMRVVVGVGAISTQAPPFSLCVDLCQAISTHWPPLLL